MNEIFLMTFQIILALLLLRLSGEIGKRSLSRGYASLIRAHTTGKLSFNLFYRVLYLPISLSIVAIILYILRLDFFIKNIWLVAIWYFGIQPLLSLNKLSYTKRYLYFGSTIASIAISYFFILTEYQRA